MANVRGPRSQIPPAPCQRIAAAARTAGIGRVGRTDRPPVKFFITIQLAHFHTRGLSFPHLSETALLTLF
jgi:hypothetical protein